MKENKAITSRKIDFPRWYTDVVREAGLADYTSVKGCIAIEPNGYAIWEKIQSVLDKQFKDLGHSNVYMPLLIPESLLQKEKDHVEGFAPEVAWVTKLGNSSLEEPMCIRPTSETLFCEYWSKKLTTYRQLPLLFNQWCNIYRNEKETRPFLRSREFLWQEGHTLHETKDEAIKETMQMINVYKKFFEEYLAIPVVCGKKTETEKFAGADFTMTIEALMQNGVSLQSGTSHYFGQNFTIPFNIKYLNRNNELEYPYQSSWGISTRMLAALIMVHGDDYGLVLPPKIAPKQVVIIPIKETDKVIEKCNYIKEELTKIDISCYIDNSEKSPGYKFAEAEVNGIPLRIEIGPRDLESNEIVLVRRDNRNKIVIKIEEVKSMVTNTLKEIQDDLFNNALNRIKNMSYTAYTYEEVENIFKDKQGFVRAMWCGNEECELKMKEIRGLKSRCIMENESFISDKCVCCGKEAKHLVIWGIQY